MRSHVFLGFESKKKEVSIIAFYSILSTLFSWPILTHLSKNIIGYSGDSWVSIWYLWHTKYQIIHLHSPFFSPYLLSPHGINLATATIMPLIGIIMTPITILFGAIVSYNILGLIAPVISGYLTYKLAYQWTKNTLGSITAGVVFAFSVVSYAQLDMGHLVYFISFGIPLVGIALTRIWERLNSLNWKVDGLFLGISMSIAAYIDLQTAFFLLPLCLVFFITSLLSARKDRIPSIIKAYFLAAISTLFFMLPWLTHLLNKNSPFGSRIDNVSVCTGFSCLFEPTPLFYWLRSISISADRYIIQGEYASYFGIVALIIGLLGLFASLKKGDRTGTIWGIAFGSYILLGLGFFLKKPDGSGAPILFLGHKILLPFYFLHKLPLFSAIMEPVRFIREAQMSLAILVAYGISSLTKVKAFRPKKISSHWPEILVLVLVIIDSVTIFPFPEINVDLPKITKLALTSLKNNKGVLFVPVVSLAGEPSAGIDDPWLTMWPMAALNHPYKIPGQYIGNYHTTNDFDNWMKYLHHPVTRYLYLIQKPIHGEPKTTSPEIEPIKDRHQLHALAIITGRDYLAYYNIQRVVVPYPANTKKVLSFLQEITWRRPICISDGCYFIVQ